MTSDSTTAPSATFGFLTVVDQAAQGLIGGYLLLTAQARPLEFHCTVPVRPNRAQEILYGPTLQPYLYGEQIARTLVGTSQLRPRAVFTDCQPALAAELHLDVPLWLVLPPADNDAANGPSSADGSSTRIDAAHPLPPGMLMRRHGANRLAQSPSAMTHRTLPPHPALSGSTELAEVHEGRGGADADFAATPSFADALAEIPDGFDLSEPFERIRAAIEEAQRGGR